MNSMSSAYLFPRLRKRVEESEVKFKSMLYGRGASVTLCISMAWDVLDGDVEAP